MIKGLQDLSDELRLYRIMEDLYLKGGQDFAHKTFVEALVQFYSRVFEYQARAVAYLFKDSLKRGIHNVVGWDDWSGMLKEVQEYSGKCLQISETMNVGEAFQFYQKQTLEVRKSTEIQKKLLTMFDNFVSTRKQERLEEEEAKILDILASNYNDGKDLNRKRIPGTCRWFLEDKRFLKWREHSESSVLWVSAGPGCGKSVLARALIDERSMCNTAMASNICYFFFKDNQSGRTRSTNALCAILHQLFKDNSLIHHAVPSYKHLQSQLSSSFKELWRILIRCAKDSALGEIICIIDALDESKEESRKEIIDALLSFARECEESRDETLRLKLIVTSRPYDDIEQQFEQLSNVNTYFRFDGDEKSEIIAQEINLVIDIELPRLTKGFKPRHQSEIAERLKQMDHRTYLWLYLTFDIIEASPSKYGKADDIKDLLDHLPRKVTEAYEKILRRSPDKKRALALLQIVCAATRPLDLKEANIALTLATTNTRYKTHSELKDATWSSERFSSTVKNLCGLLVTVHNHDKLSLIHQTAREFLTQSPEEQTETSLVWHGSVCMPTSHGLMSETCMRYLSLELDADVVNGRDFMRHFKTTGHHPYSFTILFDRVFRYYEQHEALLKTLKSLLRHRYRFLQYAALNWVHHFSIQDIESMDRLQGLAASICDAALPQCRCWFPFFFFEHPERKLRLRRLRWVSMRVACCTGLTCVVSYLLKQEADRGFGDIGHGGALEVASALGHADVVNLLLDGRATATSQNSVRLALEKAARGGHTQIVELLLDKRTDNTIGTKGYGNALYEASYEGNEDTVRLLLDRGANVNAEGKVFGTALQAAVVRSNEQIVRLLLDKGAEVNVKGGGYYTALQAAARWGNEQMVRMLLDNYADVNAQGGELYTALQAASWTGSGTIVQLLLDRNADVNAQGGEYHTALQAASWRGSGTIVQLLLDCNADVNAQGGLYHTALRAAWQGGHENTMELLLANGATPENFDSRTSDSEVSDDEVFGDEVFDDSD